jgi:hypothetical protein
MVSLAFTFAAVPLLLIGYLLVFKRRHDLMGGYARGLIADPDGAARWIGTIAFIMGAVDLLLAGLWALLDGQQRLLGYTFVLTNAVGPVLMFVGGDRYRKRPRLWE